MRKLLLGVAAKQGQPYKTDGGAHPTCMDMTTLLMGSKACGQKAEKGLTRLGDPKSKQARHLEAPRK